MKIPVDFLPNLSDECKHNQRELIEHPKEGKNVEFSNPNNPKTQATTLACPKKTVTSIMAYLIAVPKQQFGREYDEAVYQGLEDIPEAKTIRCLCLVRNKLLLQNGMIRNHIRYNLFANIDEFIEPEILDFLETRNIQLIQPQPRVNEIIKALNTKIPEKVEECKALFPDWIEFRFIRRLFTMGSDIEAVVDDIHMKKSSYPFQCYLNWPIRNPMAYPQSRAAGNVLQDDATFLKLLYQINDAILPEPKNDLKRFIQEAGQAVLAVDCENSDPYKLCAKMWELKQEDPQSFSKIAKTILFDDVHTNPAWRLLSDFLPIPVEHVLTQRVNDHKSIVDIQMTAGVAKEHYAGNVDSFLLASSDSDYWGLIKSLPTARFMVLMEQEKVGDCLRKRLDENAVGYCTLDMVNTEKIRKEALEAGIRKKLESFRIDLQALVQDQTESMMLNVDWSVEDVFSRLRLKIEDGVVSLTM